MQPALNPAVNFVQNHPEFIVARQRDPNTHKAPWLVAAIIKQKRLESEGTAAGQLCVALQSEINDFTADLRDPKNKSDSEVAAITAALADAKARLTAAKVVSHAKLGLADRAHKAIQACRDLDSREPENTPPVKRQSLSAIRAAIEKIDTESTRVFNSQRPVADLENDLRSYLTAMAEPYKTLVDLCASVLTSATPLTELVGHPNALAARGFGLAVASIGVEAIISEALAKAQSNDTGCLRMTADERTERLSELAKARYLAEIEEEQVLAGNDRRTEVSAGAVLQIPVDVAEQAGLISGVK